MNINPWTLLLLLQIDKLVKAGANVLAPIAIGPKRNMGTVVDYAYYMFYQVKHLDISVNISFY